MQIRIPSSSTPFAFEKALPWLILGLMAILMFCPGLAHAASTETGLEWEGPMTTFRNSITGPIAYSISILALVASLATLLWGGELTDFTRKFVVLILVIAAIMFAVQLLASLWGASATIG
ncbi:TrbC/VirB2 family protein [Erwinia pyrifoliae]|uniref:TrbC/VirB2 family protein n=1 Tax=Erwinia pyrifoliae TaxID=79967 RepID=UPI00223B08AC|nr:TrbC/VirB2 family protein [Erwinia pyrifoliae]MCT2388855.1 TrbC/VirB2 family protein [Erwinia pyrifoliae]MCU8589049.1 TrbC/VirB2 family protein [Erwinia pyrifoliae]